jgi:FMN phosphatase YigB (HAD superfamily)
MTSFIYFDVGGVAIKDFSKSNKWELFKKDLGITRENLSEFDLIWEQHDTRLALDLDVDELVQLINHKLQLNLPSNFSAMKLFIDRFEPNTSLWPIMNQLKQRVQIGLLTNMYPHMLDCIKQAQLLPEIDWNIVIDSSIEMLKKPEPEIYCLAETKANVNPEQIFFIDNQPENLTVPRQRGWQTFLYDSADYQESTQKLTELFISEGLL